MSTAGGETVDPPFDFNVRLGIVFIIESASLSAVAVASLLVYIAYSAVAVRSGASRSWKVSTHVHYYFVNLLVSDLIQAIGGIMDVQWVVDARVTENTLCTVQGMFKQMGDVGVALSTLSIALHTFFVLVFRWHSTPKIALVVIAFIWIFIALIVGISMATHKGQDYYGNTQYWCWITEDFGTQRIALEYLWLWVAAFGNIICYFFIALVIKGYILVDAGRIRRRRRSDPNLDAMSASMSRSSAIAMQMLFYPAVYLIAVFPMSVVRWLAFSGVEVPFAATAVASVLFSSSGLLNVLLFSLTRPGLVPNRNPISTYAHEMDNGSRFSYHCQCCQRRNSGPSLPSSVVSPRSPDHVYDGLGDWKHYPVTNSRGEVVTLSVPHSPPSSPRSNARFVV
ncbi:hypothetical protein BDZ89DRAFT_549145 [Hymenopellis radicata]|nr:hypothetical protein BDZ89DRAFT_549145 [Hymenopellis radicata]